MLLGIRIDLIQFAGMRARRDNGSLDDSHSGNFGVLPRFGGGAGH